MGLIGLGARSGCGLVDVVSIIEVVVFLLTDLSISLGWRGLRVIIVIEGLLYTFTIIVEGLFSGLGSRIPLRGDELQLIALGKKSLQCLELRLSQFDFKDLQGWVFRMVVSG